MMGLGGSTVRGLTMMAATLVLSGVAPTMRGAAASNASASASPDPAEEAKWYGEYIAHSHPVRLPDGRTLNLYCAGKGSPTIVMEVGLSENALTWWKVQPRLAKLSRVCVYDRAGLGFSPIGPMPRDTRAEVADLEHMLKAARVKPPYLLVGHSMGGYNVRLFASRHSNDVAGLVLIDPSVENQIPIMEKAVPATIEGNQRTMRRQRACADLGRPPDIVKYCIRSAPASFPPDLAKKFTDVQGLHTSQTIFSEAESFFERDSQQVIAERRSLGSMPLIVLTRGELDDDLPPDQSATQSRMLMQLHDEVAKLSSVGSNREIDGAHHYIHIDKPDAVIDAVGEVLAAARKRPKGRQ